MRLLNDQSVARSCAVCCDVAAHAVVRLSPESLPELRRNLGPVPGEPLPASFLKHADEQTIAGLSAVYRAIDKTGLQATCFHDWGVVAAPRFLGRPTMVAALQRFAAEGAWGVSPHLIPHRSLHSVSGTISQALKIRGPNFGVGGGPGGTVEILLAATALLEGKRLPGVWMVLTCLEPETPPSDTGQLPEGTQAVGLALALAPSRMSGSRLRLRVIRGAADAEKLARSKSYAQMVATAFDLLRLETLLHLLNEPRGGEMTIVQLLDSHSRIEFSRIPGACALTLASQQRPQGKTLVMVSS